MDPKSYTTCWDTIRRMGLFFREIKRICHCHTGARPVWGSRPVKILCEKILRVAAVGEFGDIFRPGGGIVDWPDENGARAACGLVPRAQDSERKLILTPDLRGQRGQVKRTMQMRIGHEVFWKRKSEPQHACDPAQAEMPRLRRSRRDLRAGRTHFAGISCHLGRATATVPKSALPPGGLLSAATALGHCKAFCDLAAPSGVHRAIPGISVRHTIQSRACRTPGSAVQPQFQLYRDADSPTDQQKHEVLGL